VLLFGTLLSDTRGDLYLTWERFKEKIMPLMYKNWAFWTSGYTLIYGVIPRYLRGVVDNLLGTIWGTIFSYISHN